MKMKVYQKGQVVIPEKIRDRLGIQPGDYVEIGEEDNFIKIIPTGKRVVELAGSLKMGKMAPNISNAVEEAAALTAEEVANEGKGN